MEQNTGKSRPEMHSEIIGQIDRILEEMRIEGISMLEFPGQFLLVMLIEIIGRPVEDRWKEIPFFYTDLQLGVEQRFRTVQQRIEKGTDFNAIIQEVLPVSSRQVLVHLWELGRRLCQVYPEVEDEFELACTGRGGLQSRPLADMMDYLTDAIQRRGNKDLFFTPYNLASFAVELACIGRGTIWDPAFGSGTLLIQAAKQADDSYGMYRIAGNDINREMVQFAHMNAFYHGISSKFLELKQRDTIEEMREAQNPVKYDYIIANPPVSSVSDNSRKEYGFLEPTTKLHMQFLQVILERMKEDGKAVVFVNQGFLFAGSKVEKVVRRALVQQFGLRAVISLPQGAFAPYTNAKASILFLDRRVGNEQPVGFYELNQIGYTLDRKREPITENDIPRILAAEADRNKRYIEWMRQKESASQYNEQGIIVPSEWEYKTGWFAERDEIRKQDYNLIGSLYRMTRKDLRKPEASPRELIQKLQKMEQKSAQLLEKLSGIDL